MRLALASLALVASFDAAAQEGRVVVAVGVCKDSIATGSTLLMRKVDQSAHFRASAVKVFFSSWDYSDDTGNFDVKTPMLAAGDWEVYSLEITTKEVSGSRRHTPRRDFSHRFTVAPGKVVDLGRYCAATQSTGEVFEDWPDKVFNSVAKLVYMHVSPNRAADVDKSRTEGVAAPLELETRRIVPPPGAVMFRTSFVEPRIIRRPAAPKPMEIPR